MPSVKYRPDQELFPSAPEEILSSGLVLYDGSDSRQVHQQVAEHFGAHLMRRAPGSELAARFRLVHRGMVSLYVLGYGCNVEITASTGDFHCIYLGHAGLGGLIVNGRSVAFSPSIVGPGDHVVQRWTADTVALIARIPRRAVDSAAAKQLGGRPHAPVRFAPSIDPTVPVSRHWLALARDFGACAADGMLRRSRFVRAHYEHMLVHGLLSGQPHSLSAEMARGSAMPHSLRRAVEFCEAHTREDLTVTDIAAAAHTSTRRLQELFRNYLGTTPLTFLRRLRLSRVHDDLLALAKGERQGNVSQIAASWGFTHLGRFGSFYRQVYGTTPSQTVRAASSSTEYERTESTATRVDEQTN